MELRSPIDRKRKRTDKTTDHDENHNVQKLMDLLSDDDCDENESDSDAESWKPDEEEGVDSSEDESSDYEADPSYPLSHTSSSPPRGRGRGRGQGRQALFEGGSWNDVDEEDTVHKLPYFTPKRPAGLQTKINENHSPIELFKLFFGSKEVSTICRNTNIHAKNQIAKGKKFRWVELKPTEFYRFVGLLFYMAILQLPRQVDYWRQRSIFSVSFPRDIMSRDRFLTISRNVHLSHPKDDVVNDQKKGTPQYDPLHRLKPLYTQIRDTCKAMWHPKKQIAIDERMIATKANISLRQYMKAKPTQWGVKLFVLADSSNGYTSDFIIYTGKSRFNSGQGLPYDVVMSLMDSSYLGRGYHLYCDNYYTSPKLFRDLYEEGFGACGTYRTSRRDAPATTVGALSKKSARGSIRWIRDQKLLFVKWMDTRQVSVCSTIHKAFSGQTVSRNIKCQETGKWERKVIAVPDAILDYNRYMGGVDLSDQLIQYYSVRRKTKKWYRTLLYHFIDIVSTNSYILYTEQCAATGKKPTSHLEFMEELAAGLCGVSRDCPTPSRASDCLPVCLNNSEADEASAATRRPNAATKGRRRCAHCGRCASWKCRRCDIVLCLVAHRNCFAEWHDKKAPVIVEDAPVEVEDDPVDMEGAPVEVEGDPVNVEDAPVKVEDAPVEVKVEDAPVEIKMEDAPVKVEDAEEP